MDKRRILIGGVLIIIMISLGINYYNIKDFVLDKTKYTEKEREILKSRRRKEKQIKKAIQKRLKEDRISYINGDEKLIGMPFIELKWETELKNVEKYDVYFGRDKDNLYKIGENILKNNILVEEDFKKGTYFWKVVGYDKTGKTIIKSPLWEVELVNIDNK